MTFLGLVMNIYESIYSYMDCLSQQLPAMQRYGSFTLDIEIEVKAHGAFVVMNGIWMPRQSHQKL